MAKRVKPEAKVSREVQQFLKLIGCSVYSTEQGYRRDKGGTRQTPVPSLMVLVTAAAAIRETKGSAMW